MKLWPVLLLALATSARADVFTAAAVAGSVVDIATTEIALSRGYVEQNIQTRGLRLGANIAVTGSCLLAAQQAEKTGHRGWARAIRLVPAVVFGGMAVHNIAVMRR